jgi:hypothetical protein
VTWQPRPEKWEPQIGDVPTCAVAFSLWDGEYVGHCLLDDGHEDDHFDGSYWFDDDGEDVGRCHTADYPVVGVAGSPSRDVGLGEAVGFAIAFHDERYRQSVTLAYRTRTAAAAFPPWSSLSTDDQRISIKAAREVLAAYDKRDED